jgi:hypothetical protein
VALLVDPTDRSVLRFGRASTPQALHAQDRIDLSEVLPEFEASVEQLFAALKG